MRARRSTSRVPSSTSTCARRRRARHTRSGRGCRCPGHRTARAPRTRQAAHGRLTDPPEVRRRSATGRRRPSAANDTLRGHTMLGLVLFFVGAVLCLNGLWLLGRIGDNEISIINYLVGGITLLACLFLAFGPGADAGSIKAAALTLLFTFTYLWVAA